MRLGTSAYQSARSSTDSLRLGRGGDGGHQRGELVAPTLGSSSSRNESRTDDHPSVRQRIFSSSVDSRGAWCVRASVLSCLVLFLFFLCVLGR